VKQCSFHILGYPMQWKHSSKCSRKYLQPHHNSTITPYRELGSCKQTACQLLWLDGRVTHTHTHPFNGPFSGTTWVSQYQKGKTNLDFAEARDSEWQWHQLGHMQACT